MTVQANITTQPVRRKIRPERKSQEHFDDVVKSIRAALKDKFPTGGHVTFSSKTEKMGSEKLPEGALRTTFTIKARTRKGAKEVAFRIIVNQHDADSFGVMIRPARALLLDRRQEKKDASAQRRMKRCGVSMIKTFNTRPFENSKWRAVIDKKSIDAYSANIAKYIKGGCPKYAAG